MADWYSLGRGEAVVGRNLLKMARREELVLATKVFYPMSDDPNDKGLSRGHILKSIDRSLQRIGTDHVDLYIVHAFDPETPIAETMQALHDVVRAGKARYLGASTMYAWQLAEMNAVARAERLDAVREHAVPALACSTARRSARCSPTAPTAAWRSPPSARWRAATWPAAAPTPAPRFDPYLEWFGDPIDREIARRTCRSCEAARRRAGGGRDGLGSGPSRGDRAAGRSRCARPGRRGGGGGGHRAHGRGARLSRGALSSRAT